MIGLLRLVAALACLSVAFSAVRLGSVQAFDILSASVVVLCALTAPKIFEAATSRLLLLVVYAVLMMAAIALSAFFTADAGSHVERSIRVVLQLCIVWIFARVVTDSRMLSGRAVLQLIWLSCMICCSAIILQGQFNLFADPNRGSWIRLTGLAEHPIEAGYVAAFGILLSLDAMASWRTALVPVLGLAICAYSLRYSASLTAFLSVSLGTLVYLVFKRQFALGALALAASVLWISYEASTDSLLFSRLATALSAGSEYETVASRLSQNELALQLLGDGSFLLGRGFSMLELPLGLEVHNTLLSAVFHFGLLGLVAFGLLWYPLIMASTIRSRSTQYRALLAAVTLVFLANSLTGPGMSRRSLWFPMVVVAILHTSTARRRSSSIIGGDAPDTYISYSAHVSRSASRQQDKSTEQL